jgi:hypothetical protein
MGLCASVAKFSPELVADLLLPLALDGILIQLDEHVIKLSRDLFFGEQAHHLIVKKLLHVQFPGRWAEAMHAGRLEERKGTWHVARLDRPGNVVQGLAQERAQAIHGAAEQRFAPLMQGRHEERVRGSPALHGPSAAPRNICRFEVLSQVMLIRPVRQPMLDLPSSAITRSFLPLPNIPVVNTSWLILDSRVLCDQ